jgi:hypothetical protein
MGQVCPKAGLRRHRFDDAALGDAGVRRKPRQVGGGAARRRARSGGGEVGREMADAVGRMRGNVVAGSMADCARPNGATSHG